MSSGRWAGASNPAYNTQAWKRARAAALRRAGNRCELGLDGCTYRATEVDHVNGIDNDPNHTNLRAACTSCHRKVTAKQGAAARRRKSADPECTPRTWWLPRRELHQVAPLPGVPPVFLPPRMVTRFLSTGSDHGRSGGPHARRNASNSGGGVAHRGPSLAHCARPWRYLAPAPDIPRNFRLNCVF
jgi:hypothetical protein